VESFLDLSHTIHDGLVTYPALPAPVITDHLSREVSKERYAKGTTFREPFRFFAVPPKIRAVGSFPVRAFAILRT